MSEHKGAPVVLITRSEEETASVAARLAKALRPGSTVLLQGDLGAGKTAFVRGMAAGLGLDPDDVSSPTFTLVQEYRGPVTLFHVDLYRLASGEVDDLGLDELVAGGGIAAVEWAEKLPRDLPGAVRVEITDRGGEEREIRVSGVPGYSER
jgi:tRNA threonylcarbamoyladenosine biosynthesis protein TsaE